MEINLPDVVAEVSAAFERYEKALVANDVDELDALFRDDPRTDPLWRRRKSLRLCRDQGVSRGALAGRLVRTTVEDRDHDLWPRFRDGLDVVPARHRARKDRPADADLGALSRTAGAWSPRM